MKLQIDKRLSFLSRGEEQTLVTKAIMLEPGTGRIMKVCNGGFMYDVALTKIGNTIRIEGFPLSES